MSTQTLYIECYHSPTNVVTRTISISLKKPVSALLAEIKEKFLIDGTLYNSKGTFIPKKTCSLEEIGIKNKDTLQLKRCSKTKKRIEDKKAISCPEPFQGQYGPDSVTNDTTTLEEIAPADERTTFAQTTNAPKTTRCTTQQPSPDVAATRDDRQETRNSPPKEKVFTRPSLRIEQTQLNNPDETTTTKSETSAGAAQSIETRDDKQETGNSPPKQRVHIRPSYSVMRPEHVYAYKGARPKKDAVPTTMK